MQRADDTAGGMRSHLPFVVALLGASVAAADEPASPHAYEIGWSQAFFSSFFSGSPFRERRAGFLVCESLSPMMRQNRPGKNDPIK